MNIDEFINKYINKKVDFDKRYGAQCVDLFRQYCKDVLNIPHTGAVEGAKDLFLNWEKMPLEKKYFDKIIADKIYKNVSIRCGDIIVWDKTDVNPYGHVAIAICKNNDNSILVFEQNGLKQDGAKLSIRSMGNMLGVLRFDRGVN